MLNHDPPDASDGEVAVPSATTLPGTLGTCPATASSTDCATFIAAQTAYVAALERVNGLMISYYDTTNRFGAAIAAGDDASADLQLSVDKALDGELVAAFAAEHQASVALVNAFAAVGQPLGPIDFATLANYVDNNDWSAQISDQALQYLAPLGVDRATVVSDLKQDFGSLVASGKSFTNVGDVLTASSDTTGYAENYASMTPDDITHVLEALTAQGAITAATNTLLGNDLADYGGSGCSANLIKDAQQIAAANTRDFVVTALRAYQRSATASRR